MKIQGLYGGKKQYKSIKVDISRTGIYLFFAGALHFVLSK